MRLSTFKQALLLLILLSGCAHQSAQTEAPASTGQSTSLTNKFPGQEEIEKNPMRGGDGQPVRQRPDTLLATGRLPLAQIIETGGSLRIVDVTGNQVLVQQTVPPRTVVGIGESGVVVSGQRVVGGPLRAEHIYQIWLMAQAR